MVCPPKVDLALERQLGDMLVNMSRDGMIDAAHDVSAGGLATAWWRPACASTIGARIGLGEVVERDGLTCSPAGVPGPRCGFGSAF